MTDRLVTWQRLELLLKGEKIAGLARQAIAERRAPVTLDSLEFFAGVAEVSATLRKGLPIPIRFRVRSVVADGPRLRIPIEQPTVLGFVPIPSLLFRVAEGFAAVDGIAIDPERKTIEVALDRFLPPFVDAEIESVRFLAGGVEVILGRGGADLPTNPEVPHERA
jgi:hypothetical protein